MTVRDDYFPVSRRRMDNPLLESTPEALVQPVTPRLHAENAVPIGTVGVDPAVAAEEGAAAQPIQEAVPIRSFGRALSSHAISMHEGRQHHVFAEKTYQNLCVYLIPIVYLVRDYYVLPN